MKLIPSIHLEDWDIFKGDFQETVYEKGKMRIIEHKHKVPELFIKSSNGKFNHIKEIDNYWEMISYNTFLNSDIIDDHEDMDYQIQMMSNIRDGLSSFESIVINKKTGYVFGVNNLIGSGYWNDTTLENMWNNDEIIIISLLDDIDPVVLTNNGWEEIDVNSIGDSIDITREESIGELL